MSSESVSRDLMSRVSVLRTNAVKMNDISVTTVISAIET